jgi:hypothetical protein
LPAETIGILIGATHVLDEGDAGQNALAVLEPVPMGLENTEEGLVLSKASCDILVTRLKEVAAERLGRVETRIIGWFYADPGLGIFPPRRDLEQLRQVLAPEAELFLLFNPPASQGAFYLMRDGAWYPAGGLYEATAIDDGAHALSIIPWTGQIKGVGQLLSSLGTPEVHQEKETLTSDLPDHATEQVSDDESESGLPFSAGFPQRSGREPISALIPEVSDVPAEPVPAPQEFIPTALQEIPQEITPPALQEPVPAPQELVPEPRTSFETSQNFLSGADDLPPGTKPDLPFVEEPAASIESGLPFREPVSSQGLPLGQGSRSEAAGSQLPASETNEHKVDKSLLLVSRLLTTGGLEQQLPDSQALGNGQAPENGNIAIESLMKRKIRSTSPLPEETVAADTPSQASGGQGSGSEAARVPGASHGGSVLQDVMRASHHSALNKQE